jgi:uncharacterized protein YjbI with pentapeptide repeats
MHSLLAQALSLLVVPVMLVLVAGLFTTMQIFIQLGRETARDQAIADQTAEFQKFLEEFRAQEASLQDYRDLMVTLLLKHHLRESAEGSEVLAIARAQTVAVLTQFDGEHNQAVTRFLSDSGLLQKPALLANTDLQDAELQKAVLQDANLAGTQLNGANLTDAVLINADFSAKEKVDGGTQTIRADLTKADLSKASLLVANLSECLLKEATLTDANLKSADRNSTELQGADLSNAKLQGADLSPATVPGFPLPKIPTNLTDADLRDAALQSADLSRADLTDADLTDANLTDADLSEAHGWTMEQLTAARSLKGAIMPDGQRLRSVENPEGPTFENWLKEKEKSQQDE